MDFRTGCEVGVSRAINAEKICRYIPDLTLYLVDPWYNDKSGRHITPRQYRWARNRMRACADVYGTKYTFIKDYSVNAVKQFDDGSLDFVYIDANHTYPHVKQDIELWSPKVRKGGVVSGHDYYIRDVVEAVNDYQAEHKIPTVFYTVKDKRHSWFWIKQ
jgi:hypothetical protein